MSKVLAGSPSRVFLTSLLFVLALFIISTAIAVITAQNSIDFAAILPDFADLSITQIDLETGQVETGIAASYQIKTIFGYLWYETFALVEFVITWLGAGLIIIFGGVADLLLKIFFEPVVNGLGTLGEGLFSGIPLAGEFFTTMKTYQYAGVSFSNSVNFFLNSVPAMMHTIKYAGEIVGIIVVEVIR